MLYKFPWNEDKGIPINKVEKKNQRIEPGKVFHPSQENFKSDKLRTPKCAENWHDT